MNTSPTIGKITSALLTFHKEVDRIQKSETNPFFKSKYASLSTILDAIKEPLEKANLAFVQFPTGDCGLTTRIMVGDEWMEDTFSVKPVKDDPQGAGSAITYMRRYALSSILGLNIDEDDDGNRASGHSNGGYNKAYAPASAKPAPAKQQSIPTEDVNTQQPATKVQIDTLKKYVDGKYPVEADRNPHYMEIDLMSFEEASEAIKKIQNAQKKRSASTSSVSR